MIDVAEPSEEAKSQCTGTASANTVQTAKAATASAKITLSECGVAIFHERKGR